MDFSNRNVQSNQPPAPAAHHAVPPASAGRRKSDRGKWARIGAMSLLAAIVILIVAVILLVASGVKSEDSYVDTGKLQAVFLNTGQVYFGNVKAMNDKYFVLTNIYYLQTANNSSSSSAPSSNANTNVTLVKLGCELHEPYDQMVINRTSVTFWENLQDGGQVAKAVSTFQKNNPQGQKCSDQSSSSSTGSSNAVQSAGNSGSSTTPSSSTTTKP
jgi:hypothetical protein